MNLNRRYREILSILLNTDGYISGNELTKICNVGVRTIRMDIKEINKILESYDIKINSEKKKGYYLDKLSKDVLKKKNIIRAVLDYKYIIEMPNSPIDRRMYILLKLTINERILINELIESLYVSESTINNDIIYIKRWLKKNLDMNLNNSLYKGISINATEVEKRNIISWILGKKFNASILVKYSNYLFDDWDLLKNSGKLYPIVDWQTKKHGYFLSGHSSQMFANDLLIAIKRYTLGYRLEELNDKIDCLPVIRDLKVEIEKLMKITLPDMEWINLQERFKAKQFIEGTNINNIKTEEAIKIVDKFFVILREKYSVDLTSNNSVKDRILLYIAPMIKRLKNKYCIPNGMNEDTSELYPLEFKMAMEIDYLLKENLDITINYSEVHYIAVILASINDYWNKRLKLIIVCDFDQAIVAFIKKSIKDRFNKKVEICGHYTYQQIKIDGADLCKNIDFIVTTSTLADITKSKFIQVNPVMSKKDIDNIQKYLSNSV